MRREKFASRKILLRSDVQRETVLSLIRNLPADTSHPLEIVVREEVKVRKPDQNALMWSGPLADIAEQGYVAGRSYTAETWHEHFKREYLPEEFDPELCKEGYQKWDYTPSGERVLVGSTTQLTVRGFALYLQQIEAFGSSIGVQFHTKPNQRAA